MTTEQLARRMKVTRHAVLQMEAAERGQSATMTSLRTAADAMDGDAVYAIVPRGSLNEVLKRMRSWQSWARCRSLGVPDLASRRPNSGTGTWWPSGSPTMTRSARCSTLQSADVGGFRTAVPGTCAGRGRVSDAAYAPRCPNP